MNPDENLDPQPPAHSETPDPEPAHAEPAHSEMASLRELIGFLKDSGIVEFASERGGRKLSLKFATAATPAMDLATYAAMMARSAPAPAASAAPAPAAHVEAAAPAAAASPATAAPTPAADEEASWHIVKSPIVGTFFESPSPGSAAFVQNGDHIEQGQVLCIIEAMKLMNEIESDGAGELVKRFVNNGQPVEYGQKLFALKPRG